MYCCILVLPESWHHLPPRKRTLDQRRLCVSAGSPRPWLEKSDAERSGELYSLLAAAISPGSLLTSA
jgi:hypothetical protein